jgi:hypothetical protein
MIHRYAAIAVTVASCTPSKPAPPPPAPVRPVAVVVAPAASARSAETAIAEPEIVPPAATVDTSDWGPIYGRATCAEGRRCPPDAPLCGVTEQGARCVARGTPEHDAVPHHRRFACTKQSDCAGTGRDGCFHVVGERDFGLQTDCGGWPGYPIPAVCDIVADRCDPKTDDSCVPCKPTGGLVAEHLPWMGVW